MALESSIVVGSFNLVDGNPQSVTLPAGYSTLVPTGFHFFSSRETGSPGPTVFEVGFDDGTYHGSCAMCSGDFLSSYVQAEHGSSDTNSISSIRNTALNQYILAGYVSAVSAGEFTVSFTRWNNIYIGRRVNYIIWGAPIQAKAGQVILSGGATTYRIEPGFQPRLLGLIGSSIVAGTTANGPGASIGYGWACDCHDSQAAVGFDSNASANPSNNNGAFVFGDCMIKTAFSPDQIITRQGVTVWDVDGVTIDQPGAGGYFYLHYLILGGPIAANIVNFQQKTSAGPQTVPISAMAPKACIVLSGAKAASTTATPNLAVSLGAAVKDVSSIAIWAGETDNQAPQTWGESQRYDNRLISVEQPTGYFASTEVAVATLAGMQARELNLNWSRADAIRRDFAAVVMAELGSVPDPSPCGDDEEENVDCGCVGPAPDGPTIALAEVELPDRQSYHHGFKDGLLTEIGPVVRSLSDSSGAPETSSFEFSLFDKYGDWRARIADADPAIAELKGLYVVLYAATDAQRRLEAPPALLFRGAIQDYDWSTDLQLKVVCENYLSCLLESIGDRQQLPRDRFSELDFPNCRVEQVAPGCIGYEADGAYVAGTDEISVRSGTGVFPPNARFQFDSVGQEYSVSFGSGNDPETLIHFSPALDVDIADGANLDFLATYDVDPAIGTRIPFGYGYISDRFVQGGIDNGDGQAPFTYVGDRDLPDGNTWGEFVWTGHRCHSPAGRPIDMLYFFNNALGVSTFEGSPNTWYFNGIAYNPKFLDIEADVGGRICLPGWPGWVAMGFGTGSIGSYRTYNGHEYTTFFMRSLYRDIALGIMPVPANLGGVIFCGSAYGWDDGLGNLLLKAGQVYKHIWQNYLVGHWRGGPTLSTPLFPDGVKALDEASFDRADAVAERRVSGGCEFNFLLGYGDESISKTDLIRRLNVCFDVNSGENEELQFAIYMEEHDSAIALGNAETLEDVNDIYEEGGNAFDLDFKSELVASAIHILHTRDYMEREPGGWRSAIASQATPPEPPGGIWTNATGLALQCEVLAPELELWLIRGRNRSIDIPDYQVGTNWVRDMALRRLIRLATAPLIYTLPTGLRAAGPGFKLGNDIYIEHLRNIGGRTARPMRIERITAKVGANNDGRVITLEGADQVRVLS